MDCLLITSHRFQCYSVAGVHNCRCCCNTITAPMLCLQAGLLWSRPAWHLSCLRWKTCCWFWLLSVTVSLWINGPDLTDESISCPFPWGTSAVGQETAQPFRWHAQCLTRQTICSSTNSCPNIKSKSLSILRICWLVCLPPPPHFKSACLERQIA